MANSILINLEAEDRVTPAVRQSRKEIENNLRMAAMAHKTFSQSAQANLRSYANDAALVFDRVNKALESTRQRFVNASNDFIINTSFQSGTNGLTNNSVVKATAGLDALVLAFVNELFRKILDQIDKLLVGDPVAAQNRELLKLIRSIRVHLRNIDWNVNDIKECLGCESLPQTPAGRGIDLEEDLRESLSTNLAESDLQLRRLFEAREDLVNRFNPFNPKDVRGLDLNTEALRKRLDELFPTGDLPNEQQPSPQSLLESQTEAARGMEELSRSTAGLGDSFEKIIPVQGEFTEVTGGMAVRFAASTDSAKGFVSGLGEVKEEESKTQQAIAGTSKEVGLSKRAFDGFAVGIKGNLGRTKDGVFSLGKAVQETSATMGAALNSGFSDAIFNTITGRFDNLKQVGLSVANAIARAFSNLAALLRWMTPHPRPCTVIG